HAGIAEHPWLPPFDPDTAGSQRLATPDPSTADINDCKWYTAALALQTFQRQFFPSRAMPLTGGIHRRIHSHMCYTRVAGMRICPFWRYSDVTKAGFVRGGRGTKPPFVTSKHPQKGH
ncbi:hypothetical protein FB451DRAFT_1027669, partial [Mycena latifolia]